MASLEQSRVRIFLTLVTLTNYKVYGIDITNTFTEALLLVASLHVTINKLFCNWYTKHRYLSTIPINCILLVK